MARYVNVEGYRNLFDEEYKKTRKLISEGETHLDNLAEGFSEASRVIDRMPTADVAPKSEVEELIRENESLAKTVNEASELIRKLRSKVDKSKTEVAREIFEEIEKVSCRISESNPNGFLRVVCYQLSAEKFAELKKKYTEGKE